MSTIFLRWKANWEETVYPVLSSYGNQDFVVLAEWEAYTSMNMTLQLSQMEGLTFKKLFVLQSSCSYKALFLFFFLWTCMLWKILQRSWVFSLYKKSSPVEETII